MRFRFPEKTKSPAHRKFGGSGCESRYERWRTKPHKVFLLFITFLYEQCQAWFYKSKPTFRNVCTASLLSLPPLPLTAVYNVGN